MISERNAKSRAKAKQKIIDKENAKTISEIADKDLRIGNLYLFSLESEWWKFRRQIGENGDYFQIDGMYAIGFPITK